MLKYIVKPPANRAKKLIEYPCTPGSTYISTEGTNLVLILGDRTGLCILDPHSIPLDLDKFGLSYLPCDVSLEITKG